MARWLPGVEAPGYDRVSRRDFGLEFCRLPYAIHRFLGD